MAIIVVTNNNTAKTLLEICQDVAYEVGFPAPSSIVNNNDIVAQQLYRLANREGEILSIYPWQTLVTEAEFTLATGDQDYDLTTIAPGYRYIIPSTTWNRDNKRIVLNPVTSQEWQFLKGWTTISGLNLRARIRANALEFEQTITAADNGKTIAFEYISAKWAETSAGAPQHKFQADDDIARIDAEVITQGVVWRFKKAKGLEWQEDYAEYKNSVSKFKANNGGSRTLNMGKGQFGGELGVNLSDRGYG